jgi:hypothetical protein
MNAFRTKKQVIKLWKFVFTSFANIVVLEDRSRTSLQPLYEHNQSVIIDVG